MISISSLLFDPAGHISIAALPSSELSNAARRVNRVKTLDLAGVAINDRGFFHGDRTFRVRWNIRSQAQYDAVHRLVRLYARLRVVTREGVFLAAPESVSNDGKEGNLSLLVIEKEA